MDVLCIENNISYTSKLSWSVLIKNKLYNKKVNDLLIHLYFIY